MKKEMIQMLNLSIDSTSPGWMLDLVLMGLKLIAKGDGNITLKFKWDDDPSSAGLAVGELTVKNQTFRQRGKNGEQRKPLRVGKLYKW